jgi:membrane protease YdiL (CAAX protease family)
MSRQPPPESDAAGAARLSDSASGRTPRTSQDLGSPAPRWQWWTAPLALLSGLLLAAVGVLVVTIVAEVAGVHVSSNLPPGIEIIDTVVQDLGFVGAAVLIAGMGGRAVHAWQFGLRPARVLAAAGLIVALYVSFLVFSDIWEHLLNLHGTEKLLDQLGANQSTTLLIASATLTCVIAPFCEEFLFRGFIFTALRNWRGPWPAAVITGLLFGGVHAESAPAVYLMPLAFLGFGLCLLYWRTGSLLPCIAAHSINNSIAFGALENWSSGHTLELLVLSLAVLGAFGLLLRRVRLIAAPPLTA